MEYNITDASKLCISCGKWKPASDFRRTEDRKCKDCMLRETADKLFDKAVEPQKNIYYFYYTATIIKNRGAEITYDSGTYITEKETLTVSDLKRQLINRYGTDSVKVDFWHSITKEDFEAYNKNFNK